MKKLIFILMVGSLVAEYKYGRIEFQDGTFIEGRNLYIEENHIIINTHHNSSKTYNKTDIVAVYKGMPSVWEIHKRSILLGSLGLSLAIVNETDKSRFTSGDPLTYPFIGFAIGLILDIDRKNMILKILQIIG